MLAKMNSKIPWDDLKTVMAIAEAGSLSGATHPDLRRVARIRAFMDFVAQAVKERHGQLLGV